jgi:hypothetical protein
MIGAYVIAADIIHTDDRYATQEARISAGLPNPKDMIMPTTKKSETADILPWNKRSMTRGMTGMRRRELTGGF